MEKCIHPLLKRRENHLILCRLQEQMKKENMEFLVLQEPHNVFYATGYMPVLNAFAVVPAEGKAKLVISTLESEDAECVTQDLEILPFMSWVFVDDGTPESWRDKGDIMDPKESLKIICRIINPASLSGNVGYEGGFISHQLYSGLSEQIPAEKLADCTNLLKVARMRKTPWEIHMVQLAAQHLERVYEATARELKPGMPEYLIQKYFVHYAAEFDELGTMGRRHYFIPAAGPHFGLCGMPRGYTLREGDIIKFDVGFTHLGFQSDIARTYAVGGVAGDREQQVYDILYKANRLAVESLKPGVKCSEIYRIAREYVESSDLIRHYPRGHVGHSVGCSNSAEEYPQLSPANDIVLEPGMTFSLETPYSAMGKAPVAGGYNLEDTFVITKDGHRAFTEIPSDLFGTKPCGSRYCPPDRVQDMLAGKVLVDTVDEKFVPLEELAQGQEPLLYFMQSGGYLIDPTESAKILEKYREYEAQGKNLLVVSKIDRGTLLQHYEEHPVPYTVISDREGALAKQFPGVE